MFYKGLSMYVCVSAKERQAPGKRQKGGEREAVERIYQSGQQAIVSSAQARFKRLKQDVLVIVKDAKVTLVLTLFHTSCNCHSQG